MKTKVTTFLLFSFFLFTSCQNEENEVIQDSNTNSITVNSPLAGLLMRVSQNPTSNDNVLDNSSCFSVQLPVSVIVNNQQIVVSTAADYQLVQDAIDAFSDDDDLVNFIYPITLNFENFTSIIVNNPSELDDIIDECDEDDGFDEIDCITLIYPISINIYNSNNQLAETVVINSNSQLFNFLENLENNVYVAIQFPISMQNSQGQTIVINNNDELEDAIEDAIDDCDDDSNNNVGNNALSSILSSGTWYVSYFFDDVDETSNYSGYIFTFNSNGNVVAVKNSITINGQWSSFIDSGEEKLELNFNSITFEELNDDWEVVEYTSNQVRLKDVSGGNGGTDYLYFSKN